MTASRWERIGELFAAVLDQPAEQRADFLASLPSTERGEVLELLRAHEGRGRLDSMADQLRGLRPAAAAIRAEELRTRLRAAMGDRYRVERELGRGGMAVVLLAEDVKHRRKVALKVLQPDVAFSLGSARFLQEIAIAARLAHPHILPLHDSGEAEGLLYYVMPYVEGESLRDRLRRVGRLPVGEALRIALQVADALSYAHEQGVIHRDIKPENILLEAGHAVVSDFGVARAMSAAGQKGLSEPGLVVGTPNYMSPEQARGEPTADGRSDIYGLGCVLYEMLAGEPPFSGVSARDVLKRQLAEQPTALRVLVPSVSVEVEAAVRRALAKRPADRFPTAAALGLALGSPDVAAARTPAVGPPRWRRAVLAITGVAALALGVLVLRARGLGGAHRTLPVIAVLPPVPTTPDTSLSRLGRDLVITLSANLGAVGTIRTVDALTVLAQTRASGPLALEQGTQLGALLGASHVVHGVIARVGPRIRIDLGVFTTDSANAIGRASMLADPENLSGITDSMTRSLLRVVGSGAAATAPRLSAVTTRSLPALSAFLEGEHASLENRWNDAAVAYGRAMHADSTFWLAYWRYAFARWWYLEAVDDDVITAVTAHRLSLPERDRLVFESWVTDSFSVALARANEVVTRYPEYWPGWMQYADWLFHVGPVYGHSLTEAQAALERTVTLNPAFLAAWEHLFWVALPRDTTAATQALAALGTLGFPQASTAEFGFDVTRVYRLEVEFRRSGRLDHPLLDSIARDLTTIAHGRVGGGADLLPAQVEISRRVLRLQPRPDLAAVHERLLAEAWAGRGAWDSALVFAERYARRPQSGGLDGYRLGVIGSWLGALPPESAAAHRVAAALIAAHSAKSTMWRAELAWLDGLLAYTARHPDELAAARVRVRRSGAVTAVVLDRSLAAFESDLHGNRATAARDLAALNWGRPDLLVPGYNDHPYVIAVARLAAGQWLVTAGDTTGAAPPLMWFDAAWALDGYRPARRVLDGLANLERARLAEREGDKDVAREHYSAFLQRYDSPVRAQRGLVNEAAAALARLGPGAVADVGLVKP